MISIKATTDITQALKQLSSIDDKIAKKVIRQSVNAGGRVATKQAKADAPIRDTGAALASVNLPGLTKSGKAKTIRYKGGQLKKSIGMKSKSYSRTKTSVAIIGPRTGFRKQIGVYTKGGSKHRKGQPIIIDPTNYAHLVQRGTKTSAPQDFLTPAGRTGAKVAGSVLSILTDRVLEEIARS